MESELTSHSQIYKFFLFYEITGYFRVNKLGLQANAPTADTNNTLLKKTVFKQNGKIYSRVFHFLA